MALIRIKKLDIWNVRAFVEASLKMKERGFILIGDNGMGKTSVVDSLEYFFTGQLKSLSSVQAISAPQSLPHRNATMDDVKVGVTFDVNGTDVVLSRSGRNEIHPAPSSNSQLDSYLKEAGSRVVILHRDKILEFVKCQPADRYQILAGMLGIEDFRERMLQVKSLEEKRLQELNARREEIQNLEQDLESIAGSLDESQILTNINRRLDSVSIPGQKSIQDIDRVTRNWLSKYGAEAKKKQCTDHIEQAGRNIEEAKCQLDEWEKAERDVISTIHSQEEIQLQEVGLKVLEKSTENECPLCEVSQDLISLRNKVEERVQENKDASAKLSMVQEKRNSFIAKMQDVESQVSRAYSNVLELGGSDESRVAIETLQTYYNSLKGQHKNIHVLNEIEERTVGCLKSLKTALSATPEPAIDRKIELISNDSSNALSLLVMISNQKQERALYEKAYKMSEDLLDVYVQSGKDVVEQYLSVMLNDLNIYWTSLHPSEPHTHLSVDLQPTRRASTRLTMESFGLLDQDPRAFSSEGHLDSLGICVFLAFVKNFHASCSLIVLDDVVSSIDSNHRQKLADLLLDRFGDRQILITTHEPVWALSLKSGIEARGVQSEFVTEEILSCTRIAGPQFKKYSSALERADMMLRDGNHDLAAASSRTYLEGCFRRVCEKFCVEMPYRNDPKKIKMRTLLDYLESFTNNRLQQGTTEVNDFKTSITGIKSTVIWGNVLQHGNELHASVRPGEAASFYESVKEFDRVQRCRTCLSPLVRRSNSIVCPHRDCANPTTISII